MADVTLSPPPDPGTQSLSSAQKGNMGSLISESISFEEYLALSNIAFEWADSYDAKDWVRLRGILAPRLQIDYSAVMGPGNFWSDMPAAEFVDMMSSPSELGNCLIATQHLIGGSTWQRVSRNEIRGTHQLRAAHQRYKADPNGRHSQEVVAKGHGHAKVVHLYRKEENEKWKLAGLRPEVYFDEFSIAEVFGKKG